MADEEQGLAGRVFGRLVGGVVAPVVDNVDVDQVVEQIDVDELIQRTDINALLDRVDPDRLLDRVDADRLIDRVDPDRLLDRVDVNRLLDRVEPDQLLDRVDPDRLLDRVDVNRLLDRVEPDQLLDRVDADRLVDRVDVDALVGRVDVNALVDRVDPDRLLDRVDVNAVVERTELGAIIARSTTGVFTGLLDVVRTRVMGVDQVAHGAIGRLVGRPIRSLPASPDGEQAEVRLGPDTSLSAEDRAVELQGRPAGAVSRFGAFLIDQFVIGVLFGFLTVLALAALRVVVGYEADPDQTGWVFVAAYGVWSFLYVAGSLAISGQTIGKTIVGVRVVAADGSRVSGRAAAVRTIVFPLSFVVFGVGFLLGLVRADRRQLHDLIGSTAVVYSWDAETTRLRSAATHHDAS